MFILYDILFFVFALAYLPYLILKRKWHKGFLRRWGTDLPQYVPGSKNIWIHAVSVGEVLAVTNLIEKMHKTFANYPIVFSTVTATGYALAREKLKDQCTVLYAPFDLSWVVRQYIRSLKPVVYISMETEIWPNLFSALHKAKIPVVIINGRISDKAFEGYRKFSFLTRRILQAVTLFCMQSYRDLERIIELGADTKRVGVVGNLKFDNCSVITPVRREDFGFTAQEQILIAGSTHPGEDEIILAVYKDLVKEFTNLRLVIAPRHVERSEQIARLCRQNGFRARKLSGDAGREIRSEDILIVDAIGHLRGLYSLADVVFIGKTLCGRGGQNMLEPLCLGKPTFVGPHTENFRDIVRLLRPSGALIEINTPEELLVQLREILKDPHKCRMVGVAAQMEIKKHQGATEATIAAIKKVLS